MKTIETKPLHILVVEDNDGDFFILQETIALSKITTASIRQVTRMEAAIAYLENNVPDIIFLDLYLPDTEGVNSFQKLKPFCSHSAVIVLSGLSDTQTALQAIGEGAQDYLAKGEFDEKILEKTIIYSLERRRNIEMLRVANERYKLVARATHDLIWDWDLIKDEVYRDEQSVRDVYGISSNNNIRLIDEWNKRLHPADREKMTRLSNEMRQNSKDFFEVEYQFLTDEGQYRYIYDRGYIIRDENGSPIRIIGAAQNITEKKKLENALENARRQKQRIITEATIRGQEKERQQLGAELHDNITQILATSRLYLDHALSGPDQLDEVLRESRRMIILASEEIRKLSHTLLPPALGEFGLPQALKELTCPLEKTGKLTFENNLDSFQGKTVSRDKELTIYRIVQEQLNNILKHADAKKVQISLVPLHNESALELKVIDDGKGFDPLQKRTGVGLRNIMSRAELFYGQVTITSKPGQGCELRVVFPIINESMHDN